MKSALSCLIFTVGVVVGVFARPAPPGPTPIVVASQQGSVLAIVQVDGTVNVWDIPQNANITIQPAAGFGDVSETSSSASLATAETDIDGQLVHAGAQ
jgi:hypothetical protein